MSLSEATEWLTCVSAHDDDSAALIAGLRCESTSTAQIAITAHPQVPEDDRFTGQEGAPLVGAHAKKQCGVERWPVKTLTDDQAKDVKFTPVPSTVKKLASLKARCDGNLHDPRSGASEFTVFDVAATIRSVKKEDDRDLHIVLEDKGWTIGAELVDPKCPGTKDGTLIDMLTAVHTAFAQKLVDGDLDGQRVHGA